MPNPVGRISGPLLKSNLQRTDDLAFETDLLYINHSGLKIGVNTDSPTRTLQVNGTINLPNNVIATNSATFGDMLFNSTGISSLIGPISITSAGTIQTPQLRVGDTYFSNNILGTYTTNTDLQLQANAAGYVDILSNLEVYGNIHATGNIVADGNITIGDDSTDSLTIGADIDSDLIPDANMFYNIGFSNIKQWNETYAALGNFSGDIAVSNLVSIDGVTVNQPIDNTYYVSSNGLDTNPGQTTIFAFATIEKALTEAASAGGNNLIFILPGTYTEDFPLTLPANTTVRGQNLRNVIIQPSTGTETEDAFLLNDGCLISDLTVKNFYYDSINDTGYGFKFDNGIQITSKSPYIQNVSVITKPKYDYSKAKGDWTGNNFHMSNLGGMYIRLFTTSASASLVTDFTTNTSLGTVFTVTYADNSTDTLTRNGSPISMAPYYNIPVSGFTNPDSNIQIKSISWGTPSGRGALVDGSVVDPASNQASMLFNAVTFITPGVDAITMTNGVRVEWIDCFTYFANRSLYATNGALGFASLGLTFGAEVRVIASASVYGNIGAEADGDQTLMYLINHNMAYVGAGKNVENDVSLVDQTKETIELNSGKIYYQSQDQSGNYRVGDTFVVNFDTGFVNLAPGSFSFTGSSLTVGLPGSQTYIDAERITLPNFTISGNTIKSDINEVNITAADGNINFLTNTNISSDLAIAGNITIDGTLINLGNQVTDTLDFEMEFTSDIIPATDNLYNLGSNSKNWDNVYTRQFDVGDITITDNYIAVNQSNLDLLIQANGTGRVVVDNLRFKTQLDSSSGNININNSTKTSIFTGKAIRLTTGNSAQRPAVAGDLRFNTLSNQFEGYNTAPVLLGGVRDADGNTRIDVIGDEFLFYANGVNMGKVSTTGDLIVNRFSSQNQFALDNNSVTVGSVTPGTVAGMTANGLGVVRFDTSNYVFNNGTIRNTGTNSDILFQMTGVQKEQQVEFRANQKGLRLPYGNTANRNPGVIGELYYNTQVGLLQVYTGTAWATATGAAGAIEVTQEIAEDVNTIWNLILA